jgi:sec-independent protein translocase protein TatC
MPVPRAMFILKKLFQFRDQTHSDEEKPFLAHLEDLRKTLTKMILTLVVAVLVCWTFQSKVMNILKAPADRISREQQEQVLPKRDSKDVAVAISIEDWEEAKKIERAAVGLFPEERETYYASLNNPSLVFHARAAAILRSVLTLPEEKRDAYLEALAAKTSLSPDATHSSQDMQKQIHALLKSGASAEIDPKVGDMSTLKPTESFVLSMKLAIYSGIALSLPWQLYFLLQFILPGLHGHERKVMWPAIAAGVGLFISGVLFAYYVVLPKALLFFANWGKDMGISNEWRIGEYMSFATQFTLLFGASFEFPVVVMVLVKLGLLTYETMARTRRYAIVAILVIAAILTPTPDIITQLLMSGPMILLYEACIWLAWWDGKKAAKAEEAEALERMERLLQRSESLDPYATEEGEHPERESSGIPSYESLADPSNTYGGTTDSSSVDPDEEPLPPPPTQEEPRRE